MGLGCLISRHFVKPKPNAIDYKCLVLWMPCGLKILTASCLVALSGFTITGR